MKGSGYNCARSTAFMLIFEHNKVINLHVKINFILLLSAIENSGTIYVRVNENLLPFVLLPFVKVSSVYKCTHTHTDTHTKVKCA